MAFSANKLGYNTYNFERKPDDDDAEEDKAEMWRTQNWKQKLW